MPGAAEVRVGEAQDGRITVAIARCPGKALVEIADLGLRTDLDHPEWDRGPRIRMALPAGPDEHIDIIVRSRGGPGGRTLRPGARCRPRQGQGRQQEGGSDDNGDTTSSQPP